MKFLFINFYTIEAAHKPPHGLSRAGCRSLPKKANDKKPGIVWAPFVKWITEHSIHLGKKSLKKTATNPMVFFSRRLRLEEFLTYCVLYISIMFLCLMMYVNVLVIRMTDKKKVFKRRGTPALHSSFFSLPKQPARADNFTPCVTRKRLCIEGFYPECVGLINY